MLLLPFGESYAKSLVVEIHRVQERRCGAVVKIGRARRQAPQDGALDLADVGAFPGNQGAARIRHHKDLPRKWTAVALQSENRQSRNIERRSTFGNGTGDT